MTRIASALLAGALAVTGCGESQDRGWVPVLASQPPTYLEQELERAREEIVEARNEVAPESAVRTKLESAESRLTALTEVFLPLYGAMLEAADAYRYHSMEDEAGAQEALDRVEEVILEVNRRSGGRLESELEQTSALVARARTALAGSATEAGPALETLSEHLNDLITRAGLIL